MLNHVAIVDSELDMMVPVALWNNVEIEINCKVSFEVAVKVGDIEVVVVEEDMKTIDFVHVVEIGSTHQNSGNAS